MLMSIIKAAKNRVVSFFVSIQLHPMEAIETCFAIALFAFAITVALPLEWIPAATSAYGNNIIKLIFAALIGYAPARLLYWRIGHGIDRYIVNNTGRQKMLFLGSLAWLYLGALRIFIAPWYPPYYIMYLSLFAIGIICYVRLFK